MTQLPLVRILLLVVALGMAAVGAASAEGGQWTDYRIGEAKFAVPADWKVTSRSKNRSLFFESGDGRISFWAEWWFADEPILGYDDIVEHRKVKLAGKPATYIRSKINRLNTLAVVFDEARSDKRQFLLHIESDKLRLPRLAEAFDGILSRTRFGDGTPLAWDPSLQPSNAAQPAPQPKTFDRRTEAAAVNFSDPAAGVAFALPPGWKTSQADRDDARVVTAASPDRDAIVLIARFSTEEAASEVEAFKGLFYGDYVLADEILANGSFTLGGKTGSFVEMRGQTYSIEGIQLAFSEGRSWFFETVNANGGHVVATVSSERLPARIRRARDSLLASLQLTDPPGVVDDNTEVTAGESAAPLTDCTFGDTAFGDAARRVFEQQQGARFLWAGSCRGGTLPLVGGDFDFDPNGDTSDFFLPIYMALLDAGDVDGFAMAVPRDRVLVLVSEGAGGEVSIDQAELPDDFGPDDAATNSFDDVPLDDTPPRTAALDDSDLWLDAGETQEIVLFDGSDNPDRWTHAALRKPDFDRFARFVDGGLTVEIPADSGRGFAGVSTDRATVWLDRMTEGAETRISWRFDPAATTDFSLALASRYNLDGNQPNTDNIRLDWHGGRARLLVNQNEIWAVEAPPTAPETVSFVLSPAGVAVEADGLPQTVDPWRPTANGIVSPSLIAEGMGFRISTFAEGERADMPARMRLLSISLSRRAGRELPETMAGDVAPLPERALLEGEQRAIWEVSDIARGKLSDFVAFSDRRLEVAVPEKSAEQAWAGLLSREPLIVTDERLSEMGETLTFAYEPEASTGIYVALGVDHVPDIRGSGARVLVTIAKAGEGRYDGDYLLTLRNSPQSSGVWERRLAADWVQRVWNGRFEVIVGNQQAAVRLDGGPTVRGAPFVIQPGTRLYAGVFAHPTERYGPSRLVLSDIRHTRQLPAGIDRIGRWAYVDADAFSADGFLSDVADAVAGMPEPTPDFIEGLIWSPPLAPAPLPLDETEQHGALDLWRVLSWFNPVGSAMAAEDCSKAIDAQLDADRKVEMTLVESPDLVASVLNVGEQLLGTSKLGTGAAEKLRGELVRGITAYRDGVAIGEDLAKGKDDAAALRIMGAVLNIGLSSGAYANNPEVRKALDANASATWKKVLTLPEDQAREAVRRFRETLKMPDAGSLSAADKVYRALRDNVDKGVELDLGTVIGLASGGKADSKETLKLAVWTLTDNALGAFAPPYKVAKAAAKLVVDGMNTGRAFVVNDLVRDAYRIWVEEKKNNDGMGATDFFRALAARSTSMPLTEVKAILRSQNRPDTDGAAEQELFAIFERWHAAETGAGAKANRHAAMKQAFAGLEAGCRNALERSMWPKSRSAMGSAFAEFLGAKTYSDGASKAWDNYWNSCQPEIDMLKRFSELEAANRQTLSTLLPAGNKCLDSTILAENAAKLTCRQLESGDDAHRKLSALLVESCTAADPLQLAPKNAFEALVALTDERQRMVFDELSIKPSEDFYNCLCHGAGYGTSGTSQYYHPDTIGEYSERWECNHPGPPCIVAGFGCSRHPLPSGKNRPVGGSAASYRQVWASCMVAHPVGAEVGADGKLDPSTGMLLNKLFQQKVKAYQAARAGAD